MASFDLGILVPVTRPWCANTFMNNTDAPVYAMANDNCIEPWRDAGAIIIEGPEQTWGQRLNRLFRETTHEWSLFVGEDVEFAEGWQGTLIPYIEQGYKVLGTNDNFHARRDNPWGVHDVVNRDYINTYGGTWNCEPGVVFNEDYFHFGSEIELNFGAIHRGLYIWVEECIIEHTIMVKNGFVPADTTRILAEQHRKNDEDLMRHRRNRWERAIKRGVWK